MAGEQMFFILEPRSGLWWGPDRCGYRSLFDAGIYGEKEARAIEALGRGDRAVPVIQRAGEIRRMLAGARALEAIVDQAEGIERPAPGAFLDLSAWTEDDLSVVASIRNRCGFESDADTVAWCVRRAADWHSISVPDGALELGGGRRRRRAGAVGVERPPAGKKQRAG